MPTHSLRREKNTVQIMIRLYCRKHHHPGTSSRLCAQCQTLLDYAHQRLHSCKFGETKPACSQCPIHCYKPEMRSQIQQVMRYAGPRMLWNHPIPAIRHLLAKFLKKTHTSG